MKIRFNLTIELEDTFIDFNNEDDRNWLYNDILDVNKLILCSTELGDTLGQVVNIQKIIQVKEEE